MGRSEAEAVAVEARARRRPQGHWGHALHHCSGGGVAEAAAVVATGRPGWWGQPPQESSLNSYRKPLFWTKSSCSSLPFPRACLLTQPNFLTRLETIWFRAHHNPTLLPSPGVTLLPNCSGNDPASIHSLSRWTPPLWVSQFVFISPNDFIQVHPGAALSSPFGRGGSHWPGSLARLLWQVPGLGLHPGPCGSPKDLVVPKQSPYHLLFNVLYNFGLQPSYMLGYHWLFTLFLRRSARCSTCV